MTAAHNIISFISQGQNLDDYHKLHWEGSLGDYLEIVRQRPEVARTAFQRIYDMIVSYGTEEVEERKERVVLYNFFKDPEAGGRDAIYGLDRALMNLADIFKSAAEGYGVERRVLLLHGPVGSSKSTVARLLKKGLEAYSCKDEGALFTFGWKQGPQGTEIEDCPIAA